ncbi:MAG: hypothetical protein J0M29_07395 [Chitinophagales bacterium]|nr:hypothetical protein [Chitinophagales bacterium]
MITFFLSQFQNSMAQGTCDVIAPQDCADFDITICQRTPAIPNPPNCDGCSAVPIDCHRIQYVVRLSAASDITGDNDLCFLLDYTDLELELELAFTGTNSGMTRINEAATLSTCNSTPISVNGNYVAIAYGNGGSLPQIEFTRSQAGVPFYTELFTIVVDVYPSDVFELVCPFFRLAEGDDLTCYFPNTNTPPTPDFIAPQAYELALDNDANVLFLTDTPVFDMDNLGVTVPLMIRSNHNTPAATLSMPYLDFILTVTSEEPIIPPVKLNATGYEVTISPSDQMSTSFIITARRTGAALTFSSGGGINTMFSLYFERPDPQNMSTEVDITFISGRFEAQFLTNPPGAIFCKKMVKGGTGDRTITFTGTDACVNTNLSLNVNGTYGSGSGDCGDLYTSVALGIPNGSDVREVRFVLEFEMSNGAYIDEANIQNGLPCNLSNNALTCTNRVGSLACYDVDGNTLTYCYRTTPGNEIDYTGGELLIPVIGPSGCIQQVYVREAAYYIVGQGTTVCVPDIELSGFPICSREIAGKIKYGTDIDMSCWVEEVEVEIAETGNACSPHTLYTACPSNPGSSTPYAYCVCDEGEYIITPFKDDNPLNGVTTYDLVLMSKHILSLEPLTTPYHIIAADANKSGSVTTFDIVELRKLILGTYTVLPNNTSWRFVPREHVFPTPSDPFQTAFPVTLKAVINSGGINYQNPNNNTIEYETADFTGIKVGDVNCSAIPCGNSGADVCLSCATYPQRPSNPAQRYSLSVPGRSVKEGEVVILPVYASGQEPVIAYQAGFRFDPAKFTFLSVSAGDLMGFTPDAINLNDVASGQFKVVWFSMDYDNNYLEPGKVLFYVALQAKSAVESAEWILKLDDTVMENLGYTPDNMELPMLARLAQAQTREESIQQTASIAVACKPNPASTIVHLDITKQTAGMTRVFVFGPYGVRMFYREIQSASGNFQVAIEEVAQWPAGIYTWQVQQGADILTGKFVKQ